jgi:hypothetical protein
MRPTGRRIYRRVPALVIAGTVAMFGASCGSVSISLSRGTSSTTTTSAAALTKAEYVARANAVCATANARNDAIGDPGSDVSRQAQAVDAGAAIAADTVRQLRHLPVPAGDGATVATIYADVDKIVKDAALLSAALRAGDRLTAQQREQDVQADETVANAEADAYGLTVCGESSGSDSTSPAGDPSTTLPKQVPPITMPLAPTRPATTTTTESPFPTLEVRPGVNTVMSGRVKPLFEIRGTGSRTTPPLVFSTTRVIGGAVNNGWVKVTIAPAQPRPGETAIEYYTNDAGSGGAGATLPRPGAYVVIVEAINPGVQWSVDLDDQCTISKC